MKSYLTLVFLFFSTICFAQTNINLHSIADIRQPLPGDQGYTFDGAHMIDARAKLLDTLNFGPSGTYPKTITIVDGYATSCSLETIGDSAIDMFYYGLFNTAHATIIAFTDAELDSFYNWSVTGGKLIIGAGSSIPSFPFLPTFLNDRWDFSLALLAPSLIIPTATGQGTTLFNGPFGMVTQANQGGGSQGYFVSHGDAVVLADDGFGETTLYIDCITLDLIIADGDAFTDLGLISTGSAITNDNDRLLANAIVYMDSIQEPPVITVVGNLLSTGVFSSYQWYQNGFPITGATSQTYTKTEEGEYIVKVGMDCGCTTPSLPVGEKPSGIIDLSYKPSISIIPNPVNDEGVAFEGLIHPVKLSIFNMTGSLIDETILTSSSNHYKTDHLKTGIYLVKFFDEKGRFIVGRKLVKF